MIDIGVHRPARAKRLNMYEMPSGAPEQKKRRADQPSKPATYRRSALDFGLIDQQRLVVLREGRFGPWST
jgi:hypothetical protein